MSDERDELQTRLLSLLRDLAADEAAIEDAYLRLAAPSVWARGWQGYEQDGRGAVLFDLRDGGWRAHLQASVDSYYLPAALLAASGGADLSDEIEAAIEVAVGTYDPRHEVVCVVLYDSGPSCSRLQRSLSAPMA